jgi:hypothetical protein
MLLKKVQIQLEALPRKKLPRAIANSKLIFVENDQTLDLINEYWNTL